MANPDRPRLMAFLRAEVLRCDFRLLDDACEPRTRFAHEQKLEALHSLCIRGGYRSVRDAERIRRQLYASEIDSSCPVQLLLPQAYLPAYVEQLPAGTVDPGEILDTGEWEFILTNSGTAEDFRVSTVIWQRQCYRLRLPTEVHSLLVMRDTGLMAA